MKDEIKEILDRLERIDHQEHSVGFEFADSSTFNEMARCFEERKKLADYITNLQEEIKEANENNKKAINLFKDDLANMTYQYAKEKDENERLKEWKEDLLKENIKLENIRKEAIQYIRENYNELTDYWYIDKKEIVDDLLNILQGSDEK